MENRASLEALESLLLASEYIEVSGGDGITVGTFSISDISTREEILEENEAWKKHLSNSNVFSVAREDGYTAYPTGLNPFAPNIVISLENFEEVEASDEYQNMLIGSLTYIHALESLDEPVVCHAKFKESKCGACVVNLAPNWSAYYTWSAASFTPTRIEENSDIALTSDELESLSNQAYESCFTKWGEIIATHPK